MTNTAQMGTRRSTPTTRRREGTEARSGRARGADGSRSSEAGRETAAPQRPGSGAARTGARRRTGWVVTLVAGALIVVAGAFASVGPYRDYQDASLRLADQQARVAVLEQENQALQAEVQRLQRPSYIEALARKDLNLGRPGEEIFVIEGIPSTPAQAPAEQPETQLGPLGRLVERLRSLW